MTLTDASPLVALVDASQREANSLCTRALSGLSAPLMTTWPCFTEAMYLLHQFGGWPLQRLLWRYIENDALRFYALTEIDTLRMLKLMDRYRDRPMDLADASLVVAAEALSVSRIFTLDRDFYIYRLHDSHPFEVVP